MIGSMHVGLKYLPAAVALVSFGLGGGCKRLPASPPPMGITASLAASVPAAVTVAVAGAVACPSIDDPEPSDLVE